MTVGVKICGVNSEAAFDAVVTAGADWLGFVFFDRSPRHVTPDRAAELSARSRGGPQRVGLFVEPTEAQIAATLDAVPLSILQVYGSPALVGLLHRRFRLPIWHAVGIAVRDDLPQHLGDAAAFLIEAKPPPGATRPGGNATAVDWSVFANWTPPGPWVLAGGLTPDNVAEAIVTSRAVAVDVSSGVESAPGVKDPAAIARFVAEARAAGS